MRSLGWRLTPPQGAARRAADARFDGGDRQARWRARLAPGGDRTHRRPVAAAAAVAGRRPGGRRVRGADDQAADRPTLQARLDAVAAAHPDRPTLSDYRAGLGLAEAEAMRWRPRREIVTPHAEIAALFGERARLLRRGGRPAPPAGRRAGAMSSPSQARPWRAKALTRSARRRGGWASGCGPSAPNVRGAGLLGRRRDRPDAAAARAGWMACARSFTRRWPRRAAAAAGGAGGWRAGDRHSSLRPCAPAGPHARADGRRRGACGGDGGGRSLLRAVVGDTVTPGGARSA